MKLVVNPACLLEVSFEIHISHRICFLCIFMFTTLFWFAEFVFIFFLGCYLFIYLFLHSSGHSSTVWALSFNSAGDRMVTCRYVFMALFCSGFLSWLCFVQISLFIFHHPRVPTTQKLFKDMSLPQEAE